MLCFSGGFSPRATAVVTTSYPDSNEFPGDSAASYQILMLNYSAYDTAYPAKIRRFIQRHIPGAVIVDFWDGDARDLSKKLKNSEINCVVIPYPAAGMADRLREYGKTLSKFVRNGGGVVITGTHVFPILQHLELIQLQHGYFCSETEFTESDPDHPFFSGTPSKFSLTNYAYPLDITDPEFVDLISLNGFEVIGYKTLGSGKIVYLGFEYYYDEPNSNRILSNAIQWASSPPAPTRDLEISETDPSQHAINMLRRSEEMLRAGSGQQEKISLNAYPNPYFNKGTLDLQLPRSADVHVDMIDETGNIVALLLPLRALQPGSYRFELPNVQPGAYFIRCNVDGKASIKKVIKANGQ